MSHQAGLPQIRWMPTSGAVALRLPLSDAVVTWFVTGSRASPLVLGRAHGAVDTAGDGRAIPRRLRRIAERLYFRSKAGITRFFDGLKTMPYGGTEPGARAPLSVHGIVETRVTP